VIGVCPVMRTRLFPLEGKHSRLHFFLVVGMTTLKPLRKDPRLLEQTENL